MGKTARTFRQRADEFIENWSRYRAFLRRRDQSVFDDIAEKILAHADAGGQQNPTDHRWAHWMSVAIEQQKEIDELRDRLDELED